MNQFQLTNWDGRVQNYFIKIKDIKKTTENEDEKDIETVTMTLTLEFSDAQQLVNTIKSTDEDCLRLFDMDCFQQFIMETAGDICVDKIVLNFFQIKEALESGQITEQDLDEYYSYGLDDVLQYQPFINGEIFRFEEEDDDNDIKKDRHLLVFRRWIDQDDNFNKGSSQQNSSRPR